MIIGENDATDARPEHLEQNQPVGLYRDVERPLLGEERIDRDKGRARDHVGHATMESRTVEMEMKLRARWTKRGV